MVSSTATRRFRSAFALTCVLATAVCAATGARAQTNSGAQTNVGAQSSVPTVPAGLSARLAVCAACHGGDGNAVVPGSPSLSAQPRLFLENQMVLIRDGLREIAPMTGMLDGFKDEELSEIAKYYSGLPAKPEPIRLNQAKAQRGAASSSKGLCGTCHLPDYRGREQMPRLSAQREDFLLASMRQFRTGQTKGRDTMMSSVLFGLSDDELSDLAHYFATRPWQP